MDIEMCWILMLLDVALGVRGHEVKLNQKSAKMVEKHRPRLVLFFVKFDSSPQIGLKPNIDIFLHFP